MLLSLLIGIFVIKSILLSRINHKISELVQEATNGRIQQVRIDLSIFHLYDFLVVGGKLLGALSEPGRPLIEELSLDRPEIELIPAGGNRWNLNLHLRGISSKVSQKKVFMTRTVIQEGALSIAPDTPEELRLNSFYFLIEPSSQQPQNQLHFQFLGENDFSNVDLDGEIGQNPDGNFYIKGEGSLENIPLSFLKLTLPSPVKDSILSGNVSLQGEFEASRKFFKMDAKGSADHLQLKTDGIRDTRLLKRLNQLNQQGNFKDKTLKLNIPLDDPDYHWEHAIYTLTQ